MCPTRTSIYPHCSPFALSPAFHVLFYVFLCSVCLTLLLSLSFLSLSLYLYSLSLCLYSLFLLFVISLSSSSRLIPGALPLLSLHLSSPSVSFLPFSPLFSLSPHHVISLSLTLPVSTGLVGYRVLPLLQLIKDGRILGCSCLHAVASEGRI